MSPRPLVGNPNDPRGTPVRQGSLREHNLALAMRQVAASELPPSRADLAAVTGLTRATAASLADELIAGGLLTEVSPRPRAGAGRPAAGLTLAASGAVGLGLEINVDYLATCVIDLTGQVLHHDVSYEDQRRLPPYQVLSRLAEVGAQARARAQADGLTVAGVTVAVPGLVQDGAVRIAPNLDWRNMAVEAALSGTPLADGLRLVIDNEANLAALSEATATGRDNFLYVSGEIGIGGGIVLNGELFRGSRGWSGEIGHVTVERDGLDCHCGSRGCLEQYAGQEAILAAAGITGAAGRTALADLQARAQAGHPATLAALGQAGTALGIAISSALNLLDLEHVVLGGGYTAFTPWLAPIIEQELNRRVITSRWTSPQVSPAFWGVRSTVVGAAATALRPVLDNPAQWLTARSALRQPGDRPAR